MVSELTGPGPRGEPQRLRWAVVEFPDWSPDSKNLSALRTVAWHDATQTRNVLRAVAAGERASRRVRQGAEHVRLFLTQVLGAGFGPIAWDELTGGSRAPIEALLPSVAAARGFNPLGKEGGDEPGSEPEDDVPAAKRHEDFLANAAAYEASVAALRDGGGKAKGLKDYPLAALRSQMQFLEERGVRVVYVVPPVPWRVAHADRLAAKGVVPSLLVFNDPAKHAALFEVSGRFDRGHVNVKGAAAFSLALADAFADVLSADAARAEGGRR
ncbi:MAG: hypothetical protein HMLKMBBP_02792 [Planctomycetes bacterium]|nr:hypothetical protein [Planctomycetota bacterium]